MNLGKGSEFRADATRFVRSFRRKRGSLHKRVVLVLVEEFNS